ncbi:hypothetical protein LXL04_022384 [Taraxacum kok-saghyz]
MTTASITSFFSAFFLIFSSTFGIASSFQPTSEGVLNNDIPTTANLTTSWTNDESSIPSTMLQDGSMYRAILREDKNDSICGFFCIHGASSCTTYLFAVLLNPYDPVVIWSANRDYPVSYGAILNFTAAGELVLQDVNGSIVNLDYKHQQEIYCLVPGQKLIQGQKLIPSVSSTNWATQKDSYSLQVTDKGHPDNVILIPQKFSLEYMKLMPNGHLMVSEYDPSVGWTAVVDLLTGDLGECFYPLACGRNSICSGNQQCSCPRSIDSFRAVNDSDPVMGCSQVTPLTCNATQNHTFIELKNVKYFTYNVDIEDVDPGSCRQACLNKCSCKAALFEYGPSQSHGNCYLPSELFTMTKVNVANTTAYIKIQNGKSNPSSNIPQSHDPLPKRKNRVAIVLGSAIGGFVLLFVIVVSFIKCIGQMEKMNSGMEEEDLDKVPGPTRFSYEELKSATKKFSKKLGEGGFGSVYEGTLEDGSKIAVKCLESLVDVNKSFLAEVESIGSIHHVNLVRLRGFCAWRSQRLLVYEFMSNGSLDQWIYHGNRKHVLKWDCRKKIILNVARGLAYLHEECRQKIIHLDIKPQNILLDDDFNAKVSDFGLSKLIDRDQSQVITRMRGTPGYLAPEWLGSIITEKVDVYSFGTVLLEILCGRKNFDKSQPQESWHLLPVFERCWEQGNLLSIVDRYSEDMQIHGTEVVEMMKVASWCLHNDFRKRPSTSMVIKVLEGVTNVESNLDYKFSYTSLQQTTIKHGKSSKSILPSILSGPR